MLLSALFLVACSSDVSVTKHDIDHDNDGFDVEVDCDDAQRKDGMRRPVLHAEHIVHPE